jgi:hypothetical protein
MRKLITVLACFLGMLFVFSSSAYAGDSAYKSDSTIAQKEEDMQGNCMKFITVSILSQMSKFSCKI